MLEIKNGNETMTISSQSDCIAIVHRVYSPYKDFQDLNFQFQNYQKVISLLYKKEQLKKIA